jgi:hypothetical protein
VSEGAAGVGPKQCKFIGMRGCRGVTSETLTDASVIVDGVNAASSGEGQREVLPVTPPVRRRRYFFGWAEGGSIPFSLRYPAICE